MNIADFGGFSGIAKMITQIKETGKKLDGIASSTGLTEVTALKHKYIDALDKFRPGNTDGVASIADSFEADSQSTVDAIKAKVQDPVKQAEVLNVYNECHETIARLLAVVKNALKKAS